jgi:C1A family cysteine protease
MNHLVPWSITCIVVLVLVGASVQGEPVEFTGETEDAPLNPEFQEAVTSIGTDSFTTTADGHLLSGLPGLHQAADGEADGSADALPAQFSLRSIGRVTPVKNQDPCGTCYAFATMASVESNIRKWSVTRDLSEQNFKNLHGFDYTPCIPGGGNGDMSIAYMSRYGGPLFESDDPYVPYLYLSPHMAPRYYVQSVHQLHGKTWPLDNKGIKGPMYKYKTAVQTHMLWGDAYYKSPATGPSTFATYYNPTTAGGGHIVTIVGWKDNFPRGYFKPYTPPGNGAFLVKNSWGKGWGNNGYFWVSYYDKNLGKYNFLFQASRKTSYRGVYYHDKLGWVLSTGLTAPTLDTTDWMANKFTASTKKGLTVKAVGFPHASRASYYIEVWRNPVGSNPRTGTLAATASGTIGYQGFHTVTLSSPVYVPAGRKFSVVMRLTTPGWKYPIPIECPISGYSSGAAASPGQSYVNPDPSKFLWKDLTSTPGHGECNVCLKAYAK